MDLNILNDCTIGYIRNQLERLQKQRHILKILCRMQVCIIRNRKKKKIVKKKCS
jgi:hypothetical protein